MPSTYTLNNGIELIGTGEQSGTWGDTTNTNLELLDTALDGQVTVTLASAGTSGSPNTLAISDGATSDGRNRMVIFDDSSDLGATAYVQLTPNDAEKIIYVRNSLSGDRSILLFQGTYSASNDYELPAGKTAVIFFDGGGAGAVAANVFNNAHFDALNVVGGGAFGGAVTVSTGDSGATAASNADDFVVEASGDGGISILNPASNTGTLFFGDPSGGNMGQIKYSHTDDAMSIVTAQNTAITIDSGRRVLIGHTSSIQIGAQEATLQVMGTGAGQSTLSAVRFANSANSSKLMLGKSRGGSVGTNVIVQDNDNLGSIGFAADDGTNLESQAASINVEIDGTPGLDDTPGRLVFATTSDGANFVTERMRITSSGNVGIASGGDVSLDSTDIALQIGSGSYNNPTIQIRSSSSGTGKLWFGDNSGTSQGRYAGAIMYDHSSNRMDFGTASDTVMNLNSSGDLNIGSGNSNHDFYSARLNVSETSSQVASFTRYASTQNGPSIFLAKSRSGTVGTNTIVQNGDDLGFVQFTGADGTDYQPGARIYAEVDGTPGLGDMPGRLIFDTTPDGASAGVERMRINKDGAVLWSSSTTTFGMVYDPSQNTLEVGGDSTSYPTDARLYVSNNGGVGMEFSPGLWTGGDNRILSYNRDTSSYVGFSLGAAEYNWRIGSNTNPGMRFTSEQTLYLAKTSNSGGRSDLINGSLRPAFQIESAGTSTDDNRFASMFFNSTGAAGPIFSLGKSRSGAFQGVTIVQNGDELGQVTFGGTDGISFKKGAGIGAIVDGTPGANDMPGRLSFSTTPDGAVDSVERMRITSTGTVAINTTSEAGLLSVGGSSNYVVTNSGQARTSGIHIFGGSAGGAGSYGGAISFGTGTGSAAISSYQGTADGDVQGLAFFTHESGTGSADAAEAMRLTYDGHLVVGETFDTYGTSTRTEIKAYGSGESILTLKNANSTSYINNNSNNSYDFNTGHNDQYFRFMVNNAERVRIQSAGGISFNGDTAAANALNDYEEGTFTPTITGSGGNPTVTYDTTYTGGRYTKIGNLVYINAEVRCNSISGGSGTVGVAGMPFARNSNYKSDASSTTTQLYNVTYTGHPTANIARNSSTYTIVESRSGTTTSDVQVNELSASPIFIIRINGVYDTN